ncbi:MAG: hypothetical protein WC758_06315 [Candidatus Woesearchaeota archaeon]|jgi:hypothetical protein
MSLFAIFTRHKPVMLKFEEQTIQLNKEIFDLLLKCETDLDELKKHIASNNSSMKDAKIAELENKFLNMHSKVDGIIIDMNRIIALETQNRDFITINDDTHIYDKMKRLTLISSTLDELLELTHEKPAASELEGMIPFIYGRITLLIDAVNNIINDDKNLEGTYSKLQYL